MNGHSSTRALAVVSIAATSLASAQTEGTKIPVIDPAMGFSAPVKYTIGLSYRPGFNIRAKFSHLGVAPAQTNPGPPTGGTDHYYDDGYNLVDSAGHDGYTWNWGYQNNSQVPGNDTIQMNSWSTAGDAASDTVYDAPQQGIELTFRRSLGRLGNGAWGLEAALNYLNLTFRDQESLSATANRLTDSYALNGVVPPEAPYRGTALGPGPLIGDTPVRSLASIPGGARVTGSRELNAHLYGLRLGPCWEIPLNEKFTLSLNGGLALGWIDSEFSYQETVTLGGLSAPPSSGAGSDSDFLVGGYVGANFWYALTKSWGLFMGAEYQYLTGFSQTVNGREATLDFSRSIFPKAGLCFSF